MKKFSLLFILLITGRLIGQSDFDQDQQLVYTYLYSKEIKKAKNLIDRKFLNSEDDSRRVIGYIYLSDYYSFVENEEEKVRALENAKKIASVNKNSRDEGYLQLGYARYYEGLAKNELFIKSINEGIKIFSKYPNENFILAQFYFLRYKYKTKNFLEKDTRFDCFKANEFALKSKNNLLINFTYSNIGFYYKKKFNETQNRKYLDSANTNYLKSYSYINLIKNPEARKRSLVVRYLNYGSLVSSLFPNNYQKTLELYKKVIQLTQNDDNYREVTSMTYNNIGSDYENLGQEDLAEKNYLISYNLSKDDNTILTQNKLIILDNLSRIYEQNGQFDKALNYQREAKDLIKNESEKQFNNNTKAQEIFYQTEYKNKQIEELKRRQRLYLVIIVLSVFGIFSLIYFLYNRSKLHINKTALLEAEKNSAELTLQLEKEEKHRLETEQKLAILQQEQLQKQAMVTSLQLDHKNTFINELKEKIKQQKEINLDKILKEEQLADNNFNGIQQIIQDVHPNFFKRLQELSKTRLTNLDLKYAAYIYINMDNLQIANTLKADPNTVRKTKYRLKQKFGLTKENDLQDFIQSIEL
ncbi:tetratricopeptide repeat protein [Epilithonimonas pallida]|uniref:Tetratricopeptide repeat-containing protein n=1 Tax=Epilithonimonas pallida TaxID=373671 RepID=A0ABY1R5X1_9FLAO|nr:tetratricopeptide repeat protein [Epilithonimonas pallida]SMP95901.1 Tetratricopeptide repeat-containing protein [Epilithonimonas pallida]